MPGRIHSFESFSTQDGPGIRQIIFLQGCMLRCKYCHNPDTWDNQAGELCDVREIINKLRRYKPYMSMGGGVTLSGGEPFCQADFALELLYELKQSGVHTAVDTAGWPYKDSHECMLLALLAQTDLLLIDIKASTDEKYEELTGASPDARDVLLAKAIMCRKEVWLRHVLIPDYNTSEYDLSELADWLLSWQEKGLEPARLTLLPYHRLGIHKYQDLAMNYVWESKPALENEQLSKCVLMLEQKLAQKSNGISKILIECG